MMFAARKKTRGEFRYRSFKRHYLVVWTELHSQCVQKHNRKGLFEIKSCSAAVRPALNAAQHWKSPNETAVVLCTPRKRWSKIRWQ